MKIGIELNYVIRDINSQMLKYYKKDIDKKFDDTDIEMGVTNFIDSLGFKGRKSKENFLYVDYPYEIFGCAKTMHRNTGVMLNNWLEELDNKGIGCESVSIFSLKENALSIQSTYYFLSKIGCRVRDVFFPKDGKNVWNKCDVVITTNERVVRNKPEGKKVILILTKDNEHLSSLCDKVYASFTDILTDDEFLTVIRDESNKVSFLARMKNKFYKFFK